LFPNAVQPTHGVFVENRLRHLVARGRVTSQVVAPVPWFPRSLARLFPSYAAFADVPRVEVRHGLDVFHPRFPVLPKFGMNLGPMALFARALPEFHRLRREGGDFDLIDAHYFYPDGVAAILLGKAMNKPVVITARGTDINLIPNHAIPRRMIRYAAREAAGVITVSRALKERLVALGVAASHVRVLRNGVDLETFHPGERSPVRARLGLKGCTLLSIGNLIESKGHHLAIKALLAFPEAFLMIAGEGPERPALSRLVRRLGLADRVRFLGRVPHEQLPDIYTAADALVLASSREGWPNVLLEAMACGTPVVASAIGGIPEVVTAAEAGVLIQERDENGVAKALGQLFQQLPERTATRRYAEKFGWDETTEGQIKLFSEILHRQE
jgi:teichuronic acid biosynthesis glycosyltransferase TuaC